MRYQFIEPFTGLIERAAGVAFHLLPTELTADPGFVADTGLADCVLATLYLAR